MRPSRIADDYVLALGFIPPAMTEPDALAVLDSFVAAITAAASEPDTANALAVQLSRAAIQLRLALGFTTPTPPTAADLLPLVIHPGRRAALTAGIRALWITRLRPLVQAQRCTANPPGPRTATNDCVLLAVLTFPVVNPGTWQVRPGAAATDTNITIDESSRPLLLAANAAQRPAATAFAAATPITPLAFMTAAGNAPFDAGTIIITGAAELRLPGATAATAGRRYSIRNAGTAIAALTAPATTSIGGQNPRDLAPGAALVLVSDGSRNWQVTAQTAGRD